MKRTRIVIGISAIAVIAAVVCLFTIVVPRFQDAGNWSREGGFGARLADGVAEAVGDGVSDALSEVEADLANNPINGKVITLDDLAHWHELIAGGKSAGVRREIEERFGPSELRRLARTLKRLARKWDNEKGMTKADVEAVSEAVDEMSRRGARP